MSESDAETMLDIIYFAEQKLDAMNSRSMEKCRRFS